MSSGRVGIESVVCEGLKPPLRIKLINLFAQISNTFQFYIGREARND